jgi:hypothetical protein
VTAVSDPCSLNVYLELLEESSETTAHNWNEHGTGVANYLGERGEKSRQRRRRQARDRNTSLVEKLNRTLGATPRSLARNPPDLRAD